MPDELREVGGVAEASRLRAELKVVVSIKGGRAVIGGEQQPSVRTRTSRPSQIERRPPPPMHICGPFLRFRPVTRPCMGSVFISGTVGKHRWKVSGLVS